MKTFKNFHSRKNNNTELTSSVWLANDAIDRFSTPPMFIYSFWIKVEKLTSKLLKLVLRKLHFTLFIFILCLLWKNLSAASSLWNGVCAQYWRSVYKEILSVLSNVMSRAKRFNGNTFKIYISCKIKLSIGFEQLLLLLFSTAVLEFPRTEDKWTIKWDHECGIKMSLWQFEVQREGEK